MSASHVPDRDVLLEQMLCSMIDVVVSKASHGEVAVVIIWLESDGDSRVDASLFGGLFEVLRQKLSLLIKVVSSSLSDVRMGKTF